MNKSKQFHISSLVKSVFAIFAIATFAFAGPVAQALPTCTGAAGEVEGTTCVSATSTAKGAVTEGIKAAGGGGTTSSSLPNLVQSIINALLFIAGAIAVIMIILGGIRYITSNGDQAHVKAAKDTIMYAIIGLVVTILAYAIVQFIVSHL